MQTDRQKRKQADRVKDVHVIIVIKGVRLVSSTDFYR